MPSDTDRDRIEQAMNDPRANELKQGYAPIAAAYREHLGNELDRKPLDRAFLDAFVERVGDGLIVDVGCGPGHVAAYLAARGGKLEGSTCRRR